MDAATAYLTTGDIARRLNATPMNVRHVIELHGIAHTGRAGLTRIYTESSIVEVEKALASMTKRRQRAVPAVTT